MAQCTAPVRGHRTASAAAACPACSSRYHSYGSNRYSPYSSPYSSSGSSSGGQSIGGGSSRTVRPRWSRAGSSVLYTPAEVRHLHLSAKKSKSERPYLTFVTSFCATRGTTGKGPAKELHDLLVAAGVKVWFSEKDLGLGVPMMRAIDKGLANSRIGLVLVTPALLARLPKEGVADKELSALLAGNQLVPIVHNTTYEALRNVSPLLASRSGLDTAEDSMAVVAAKIAELVAV